MRHSLLVLSLSWSVQDWEVRVVSKPRRRERFGGFVEKTYYSKGVPLNTNREKYIYTCYLSAQHAVERFKKSSKRNNAPPT